MSSFVCHQLSCNVLLMQSDLLIFENRSLNKNEKSNMANKRQ